MTAVADHVAGGFRVSVARTVEEVEALRESWQALQGSQLTTDIDYFLTVIRSDRRVIGPHVTLFERDGRPLAMIVARLEERKLSMRFGYSRVYEPRVRSLTVVYGGFLGPAAEGMAHVMLDELVAALGRGEADVVRLQLLRTDSPIYRLARTRPSPLCRQRGTDPKVHWRVHLPGTYEDFLGSLSSRMRGSVRRYAKRLELEYAGALELRVYRSPHDIDTFFRDIERVATKTYQRGLGVAVQDNDLQRAITALGAERGWFRAHVLFIGGEPAAFWHGFGYRGAFRTGVPGFDPAYRKLNIGSHVLMSLVAELCADPAIKLLDFGSGDAEYKQHFSDENWVEDDVLIFAQTARGIRINLICTAVVLAANLAKRIMGSGAAARIKKAWRRRVTSEKA